MSLVSKGIGLAAVGRQAQVSARTGARSIHIPLPRGPPPAQASSGGIPGKPFIRNARNLISRFLTHLTTPGFTHSVANSAPRSLHTTAAHAVRQPTIQQGFSLPVKHALRRPLTQGGYVPRLPSVPRRTTDVGLQTARNFSSSGRPLFQQIVENVPIAGRTISQADWDLQRKAERKQKMRRHAKDKKQNKENVKVTVEMTKPKVQKMKVDLDHYFPEPASTPVTTYLYVPLAPTPTARFPLSDVEDSLIPRATVQNLYLMHETHSARVSWLFSLLDKANVWERGASYTAHGDVNGLCTILKVRFKGWSEGMVREVIPESRVGWCEIQEVHENGHGNARVQSEGSISDMSSSFSSAYEEDMRMPSFEPSESFVLPTLSFSSSVQDLHQPGLESYHPSPFQSTPGSPIVSQAGLDLVDSSLSLSDLDSAHFDGDSEGGSDGAFSELSWLESVYSDRRTNSLASSWIGFSSEFTRRAENVTTVEIF